MFAFYVYVYQDGLVPASEIPLRLPVDSLVSLSL